MLELEPLPAEPHTLPLPDHSIAFHVAHSPLREILAKASPHRSGDVLAGVAAASAQERVAAQLALADAALEKTGMCVLVDKEEIGSVGATGMASQFFENTVASHTGSSISRPTNQRSSRSVSSRSISWRSERTE